MSCCEAWEASGQDDTGGEGWDVLRDGLHMGCELPGVNFCPWCGDEKTKTGYVVGIGEGDSLETLSSYLAWFPAEPGKEWVHPELPADPSKWDVKPEWYRTARYTPGTGTKMTGKKQPYEFLPVVPPNVSEPMRSPGQLDKRAMRNRPLTTF